MTAPARSLPCLTPCAHPRTGWRRRAAALACLLLATLLATTPAHAQRYRLLVNGQDRQLRSVQLETQGFAASRSGPEAVLEREAVLDAKRRAVAQARADLETKLADRGLAMELVFLGESAMTPHRPDAQAVLDELDDEAVWDATVFIHSVEPLAATRRTGDPETTYGVTVRAEVVYIIQKAGAPPLLRKPPPLPMAAPGQSPQRLDEDSAAAVREEAAESMAQRLLEALTPNATRAAPEQTP